MSAKDAVDVVKKLEILLDAPVPEEAASDINIALDLAACLKAKGFEFKLQDACPKSMSKRLWKASFIRADRKAEVENKESAMAVCLAALKALQMHR